MMYCENLLVRIGEEMHPLLKEVSERLGIEDNIRQCSIDMLNAYGKKIVAEHSRQVANEAKRLAILYQEDFEAAEIAGYLHDISVTIQRDKHIEIAEYLDLDVLPEERAYPLIIHQKLSSEIARIVFGILDERILSAICCHSTLKANPTKMDLILFIADKIKWDQGGIPPYNDLVQEGLNKSLEDGVFAFVKYLYDNKSCLKVIHPWLVDAYNYLGMRLGSEPNII
ncbi:MAG TPA: HD domain-containing protein [Patescibacteria group bacterium]|nr:HD domain-containing protein [Patescibacteria group bacterium]